ncbi:hypothetical protein D3C86_1640110 [compost metagenome]
MATEAGARHQRLLEVHRIPHPGLGKTGARERLKGDVGGVTLVSQGHHGEADAVGGDGVAQLDIAKVQGRGMNGEGHVIPLTVQGGQGAHGFDNSGKHADHLADDGGRYCPLEH